MQYIIRPALSRLSAGVTLHRCSSIGRPGIKVLLLVSRTKSGLLSLPLTKYPLVFSQTAFVQRLCKGIRKSFGVKNKQFIIFIEKVIKCSYLIDTMLRLSIRLFIRRVQIADCLSIELDHFNMLRSWISNFQRRLLESHEVERKQ